MEAARDQKHIRGQKHLEEVEHKLKSVNLQYNTLGKVMHPKYSKHLPYTVASTIDCGCSKMLNHGLNHGFFLSLFKFLG